MRRLAAALACVWACVGGLAIGHAQTVHQADFDTIFPSFGYSYDYSGYGDPAFQNVDSSDQTSSSYEVMTSPAATGTLDTTAWVIPPDSTYNYAGWGLGIGLFMNEDARPTSGDLSQYTVKFDASVSGYEAGFDGLDTELNVLIQIPDNDGDGGAEEVRLGVNAGNLGNLPALPFLSTVTQSFEVKLSDLVVQNEEYDFETQFADVFILILQLAPNVSADEVGIDADNVITVDNVRFEGPFASPFGGDFNFDNVVDGSDFLSWQRGESPGGVVTEDLDVWKANYGRTAPAGLSAVPEPGGVMLATVALLAAFSCRRSMSKG
jgi:hypothetical protein